MEHNNLADFSHIEDKNTVVTLTGFDGRKRLKRTVAWCERNAHIMRSLKLSVINMPQMPSDAIAETLDEPPQITTANDTGSQTEPTILTEGTAADTALQENTYTIEAATIEKANNTSEQDPIIEQPAKNEQTETIEQAADDLPEPTAQAPMPLKDAAAYLGITYQKLAKFVRDGQIESVQGKTAKSKAITVEVLDAFKETL